MQLSGAATASNQAAVAGNKITNKTMGKDDFLKLLVTQLQNQDPLKPMDNTEFVSQLAQFSSLEGITNLEKTMEGMAGAVTAMQNYSTANLIGRNAKAEGREFAYSGAPVSVGYSLDGDAAKVSVSILDRSGVIMRRFEAGPLRKGEYAVDWDGKDAYGSAAKPGVYSFKLSAVAADDSTVGATQYITGTISGVNLDAANAGFVIGGITVPKDKIKAVY